MSELQANKEFLLEQSAIENNFYQLFVSTDGGASREEILQENDSKPKIEKLGIRAINQYIGIYTTTPNYSATIVKSDELKELIKAKHQYYIVFSDGSEDELKCSCVGIEESKQQGLYWVLLLAGK